MSRSVLFLAPIYEPHAGGAAVHFEQLSHGLTERGAATAAFVLTCYAADAPVLDRNGDVTVARVLFSPSSLAKRYSRLKVAYNYAAVAVAVVFAVSVLRVSVVHTQTKRYFEWGVRIGRTLGAFVIVDGRDLGSASFGATGHVFVACSQRIAELATDRTERVIEIPVGIDPANIDVGDSSKRPIEEPYVLFVGDIERRKGADALLSAVREATVDTPLVLVGELLDPTLLQTDNDRVQYLGPQPHDVTVEYIASAELVVLPSREEGMPRVALEAFYVGTPILCPPVVREFHEHVPELVFPEITPAAIATALEQALAEPTQDHERYPIRRHFVSNVIDQYAALLTDSEPAQP